MASGYWWSDRTGGLIGAFFGITMGTMGGVIGWLSSRGKARNLVLALVRAMQIIGVGCLALGIVAVALRQPYAVYYPMVLVGILCPVLGMGLRSTIRRRYDEVELRKMSAMDAV
jgi:hypothetical protein